MKTLEERLDERMRIADVKDAREALEVIEGTLVALAKNLEEDGVNIMDDVNALLPLFVKVERVLPEWQH